jgi:predicted phosphodiesterase
MKIAILSDIHANYCALQAVLQKLDWISQETGEGFAIRFLGDIVGYGPVLDAVECLDWLFNAPNMNWVPGNHDEWILSPNGGVRFEAKVSLLSQRLFFERPENKEIWAWFQNSVQPFLNVTNNSFLEEDQDGFRLVYSHASVVEGQERGAYLYPWQTPLILSNIRGYEVEKNVGSKKLIFFFGHTHFPMLAQLVKDKIKFRSIKYGVPIDLGNFTSVINPGSVGQSRDGDNRASFATIDTEVNTVTYYRVDYNKSSIVDRLNSEKIINSTDRPNRPSNHPLTLDERKILLSKLGLEESNESLEKIKTAYVHLIQYIETGDGGDSTSNYLKVYAVPEFDLQSVDTEFHQPSNENVE